MRFSVLASRDATNRYGALLRVPLQTYGRRDRRRGAEGLEDPWTDAPPVCLDWPICRRPLGSGGAYRERIGNAGTAAEGGGAPCHGGDVAAWRRRKRSGRTSRVAEAVLHTESASIGEESVNKWQQGARRVEKGIPGCWTDRAACNKAQRAMHNESSGRRDDWMRMR